jgi:plastocyanin
MTELQSPGLRRIGGVAAIILTVCLTLAPTAADAKKNPKKKKTTAPTTAVATTPPVTVLSCTSTAAVRIGIPQPSFTPNCATVTRGTTVTWTWEDPAFTHSVTSDTALFDSGVKNSGTFEYTFAEPGTYTYYCTVHGKAVQNGTIQVT